MKWKKQHAELCIPLLFLAVSIWYLIDAYRASATTENLLLILPAGVVIIGLSVWILFSSLLEKEKDATAPAAEPPEAKKEPKKEKEKKDVSILGAMLILAGYVLSMNYIGFDVATFLFVFALMFLQGERRLGWLASFPLIFSFLVSIFFQYMIPYPMPMLLGKEFFERLL